MVTLNKHSLGGLACLLFTFAIFSLLFEYGYIMNGYLLLGYILFSAALVVIPMVKDLRNESNKCHKTRPEITMEHPFKQDAIILWNILDDIDTLSDRIKPSTLEEYQTYLQSVTQYSAKRFQTFMSDGFSLFKNGEKIN